MDSANFGAMQGHSRTRNVRQHIASLILNTEITKGTKDPEKTDIFFFVTLVPSR